MHSSMNRNLPADTHMSWDMSNLLEMNMDDADLIYPAPGLDIDLESHLGHRDRLRYRVARRGLDGMPHHEILEYLLYSVIPRQDVNELSHALMEHFGSLEGVLRAGVDMLCSVPGVGLRTAQWLALAGDAIFCCGRLYWEDRPQIGNLLQTLQYACHLRRGLTPPCSVQLCLDINDRLLFQRTLTNSRAWGEPIYLRRALADVLENQAARVLIFQFVGPLHTDPDEYDINRARAYADTLFSAQSCLTDVLLIGEGGMTSMRQLDLITTSEPDTSMRFLREDYLGSMPNLTGMNAEQLRACLEDDPGAEDG